MLPSLIEWLFSSHWCREATRWSPCQCSWRGGEGCAMLQQLPSDRRCLFAGNTTNTWLFLFVLTSLCLHSCCSGNKFCPGLKNLKKYRTDSHKVYYTYPQSLEGTSYFLPPQSFDYFETALCLCDVSQQSLVDFAACTDINLLRLEIPWDIIKSISGTIFAI